MLRSYSKLNQSNLYVPFQYICDYAGRMPMRCTMPKTQRVSPDLLFKMWEDNRRLAKKIWNIDVLPPTNGWYYSEGNVVSLNHSYPRWRRIHNLYVGGLIWVGEHLSTSFYILGTFTFRYFPHLFDPSLSLLSISGRFRRSTPYWKGCFGTYGVN